METIFWLYITILLAAFVYFFSLREKAGLILYRSMGAIACIIWFASSVLFGDDELGIGGFIVYDWTLEIAIIMLSAYFIKNKKFLLIPLLFLGISCYLAYTKDSFWIVLSIPLLPYFICYGIAMCLENKLQKNFPRLFKWLINLSFLLFLINIILIFAIAIYDHRLFGYIRPFRI